MAIRISRQVDQDCTIFKVDGRLETADLEEFVRVCGSEHGAAALDLSELQSADREGAALLRELAALGVEIRGASPYIELLLRAKP